MRLNKNTNRFQQMAIGCIVWACSVSLYADQPPRHLPLPIEVVAAPVGGFDDRFEMPAVAQVENTGLNSQATFDPEAQRISNSVPFGGAGEIAPTSHANAASYGPGAIAPVSGQGLRIGQMQSSGTAASSHGRPIRRGTGLPKVVASLAVVLGLLFGFVWASRRLSSSGSRGLPDQVVQVLGQFPLGGRQQATIVRFGSKLLALSITPAGVETIAELNDEEEVENLTQLCLGGDTEAVPGRVRDAVDRYAAARGM